MTLPQELRDLIETGPLAYLSTINTDGSPQVTMIWIGRDGDDIVSAHMRENLKLRNIQRDPRVVLSFAPPAVPGEWLSPHAIVRATATVERGNTAALMNRLAPLYTGVESNLPEDGEPGWIVRYAVDRITGIGPWANPA